MDLTIRSEGNVTILEISGRFDNRTAPAVAEELEKVTRTEPARLVVNMTNVSFVDSTALATLVQGLKRCRQRRGELYLCGLQNQVYMIFELTRLDKAFTIFPDEANALQAFEN